MNKLSTLILALCFTCNLIQARESSLSAAAALLFKNCQSKLSIANKNAIVKKANLQLAKNGKQFILSDAPDAFYEVNLYPVDMNHDGTEEVFILQSSSYFGGTGMSCMLFIKDVRGVYQLVLNDIAMPSILTTKSKGYPDILLGGQGFEHPAWRFNGSKYVFFKRVKENGSMKMSSVEELSETYCASLMK